MTGVALRDADAADLDWIASNEVAIFGAGAWSPEMIRADWADGGRAWRIAEYDGSPVGYAVHGMDGDAFSLMNLAVAPAARRRGVGAALVADCVAAARRHGAAEVWLEVAVDNAAAIAMYRSHGFRDVRVRRRYYQPEGTDALVMAARVERG